MEDQELIKLARQGNEGAFNSLLSECMEKVKNSISKQYKLNNQDLEDVMQGASIKAWQNLDKFRGDASFSTWLHCIVRNEACDYAKAKNRIESNETSIGFFGQHEEFEDNGDLLSKLFLDRQLDENAQAILARREQVLEYQKMLEYTMSHLGDMHRNILEMSLDQQMSYKEIASHLNIPVGTVMSRMHLARRHAQKLITDYAHEFNIALPIKH